MPKCLNDATKTYVGDEFTPKGLGYSASGEKVGTIMKGRDGNDYIVHETKTCLKWLKVKTETTPKTKEDSPKKETSSKKKNPQKENTPKKEESSPFKFKEDEDPFESCYEHFSKETEYKGCLSLFEKIKKENPTFIEQNYENNFGKFFFDCLNNTNGMEKFFYHSVFMPRVAKKPLEVETGLEEKFGGEKPFFIEGETWPVYEFEGEKKPFEFICQYYDPKIKDKNIFVRLFLPLSDNEASCDFPMLAYYHRIELDEETKKKQIIIPRPNLSNGEKYVNKSFTPLKPYQIEKLVQFTEIKKFDYIMSEFKFPSYKMDNELYSNMDDEYWNNRYCPSNSIKIGGTRTHTQFIPGDEPENILQITEECFLPINLGDDGIGHIDENKKSQNQYDSYYMSWDCY